MRGRETDIAIVVEGVEAGEEGRTGGGEVGILGAAGPAYLVEGGAEGGFGGGGHGCEGGG